MYSLSTIKELNRKAVSRGKKPILLSTPEEATVDALAQRKIKHVTGAWVDKEPTETLFVDHSGFGGPGEMAYTQEQFSKRLQELIIEHGPIRVGITESGQFQSYVGVWKTK